MKYVIIVATLFLNSQFLTKNAVNAQSIFVSIDGNDQNDGTKDRPVATINRALEVVAARPSIAKRETVVNIGAGNYQLTQPIVLSETIATINQPIIFRGNSLAKSVITGGYKLSGFQKVSDSLWKAVVPGVREGQAPFQQLYVNGKRATRARNPNKGFTHPEAVIEIDIDQGTGKNGPEAKQLIKLSKSDFNLLNGMSPAGRETVVLKFYHNWDNTIKPLAGFDVNDSSVVVQGRKMFSRSRIKKESLMIFENARSFVDEPGEWFLASNGELFYFPRAGETIDNVRCEVPATQTLVRIKGKPDKIIKYISFENITFQMSGYQLTDNIFEPLQAAATVGAAIEIDFAEHISFSNCDFRHMGANAIWFRRACSKGLVAKSIFNDLGAGAIKIGEPVKKGLDSSLVTHHIMFDNNIISAGGRVLPCAVAVAVFNSSDNVVSHNDISDFFYTGVSVGWTWGYDKSYAQRNKIVFNRIYDIGQGLLSDMGGIYTLGISDGTVIGNNVIYNVLGSEYGGWGIYCDEGTSNILVEKNLVYACGNTGFHQHYGRSNIVRNNIFALDGSGELQLSKTDPQTSLTFTNNILYAKGSTIFVSNWLKSNIISDANCYWTENVGSLLSNPGFDLWKKTGNDQNSIFLKPFNSTTSLRLGQVTESVARKINFNAINVRKAGVYGQQLQTLISAKKEVK